MSQMKTRMAPIIVLLIFGIGLAVLGSASPTSAAGEPVPVSITVVPQVAEGKSFVARVSIANVTEFDAAQYDVTYIPSVLNVTGVSDGLIRDTTIPVSSWSFVPSDTQGRIRVINNVPNAPGVTGSGYLAEVHFRVVGPAGSASETDLVDVPVGISLLGDKWAREIPASWSGREVQITTVLSADFSADKLAAKVGEVISFSGAVTGGTPGYEHSWDFDNDGTRDSTEANPTHSYGSSGTYTVSLTASDGLGDEAVKIRSGYIIISPNLMAEAELQQHEENDGVMVLNVIVKSVKDLDLDVPVNMVEGLGDYNATVSFESSGLDVLDVRGIPPFATVAKDPSLPNTVQFSSSQIGHRPLLPVSVARLVPVITGAADSPYELSVRFSKITEVGGALVSEGAPVTMVFLRGDANGDGSVTITDALLIAQHLAKLRPFSDINAVNASSVMHDGPGGDKISIVDALFIAQYRVQLRDAYYNLKRAAWS